MFSENPLRITPRRFTKTTAAQAVRLAIMAELDAINLYVQLAEAVEDIDLKKVFLDIAREEKTHLGEFLEMLRRLDPEQVEELESGRREVEELLGES